jgi:hypothetical protein
LKNACVSKKNQQKSKLFVWKPFANQQVPAQKLTSATAHETNEASVFQRIFSAAGAPDFDPRSSLQNLAEVHPCWSMEECSKTNSKSCKLETALQFTKMSPVPISVFRKNEF